MSIATEYFESTGERVIDAALRMFEEGKTGSAAAMAIGYGRSTQLRKYLECRGVEWPWPPGGKAPHTVNAHAIPTHTLERYLAMRQTRIKAKVAGKALGYNPWSLHEAAKKRLGAKADVLRQRSKREKALDLLKYMGEPKDALTLSLCTGVTANWTRAYLKLLVAEGLAKRIVESPRKIYFVRVEDSTNC